MALPTFDLGGTRLTRVPYFDIALGPEVAGLTGAEVAAIPWAVPVWADDDQQVIVGQAVWVIEAGDRVLVVDPCGAADTFLRSGADAVTHQDAVGAALTAAGFAPDRVDAVILSHLDGIGMAAAVDADGAWTPFFPRARGSLSAPQNWNACARIRGSRARPRSSRWSPRARLTPSGRATSSPRLWKW